jgi:protein-tyrosine-phosphatase
MAQAFFNQMALASGLDAEGLSAGTAPSERVNAVAVEAMREVGIDMSAQRPQQLTPEMARAADKILTMGCGVNSDMCPAGTYISEDWALPDPHGQGIEAVREVRDMVHQRVATLINEMQKNSAEATSVHSN